MVSRMTSRVATCSCGAISITCEGEPVRVSVCHCLSCQRRTGSAFSFNARYPRAAVRFLGQPTNFMKTGDDGSHTTMCFCPRCGTTVWWVTDSRPEFVMVAVGAFADPSFPAPAISVFGERKHPWVGLPALVDE
jgi:hypothetical protein